MQPLSRDQMARRAAGDIPEGWCVNLGIGIPTLVANHVPPDREVIFQSENGDLANWARSEGDTAPAIGGAMDLAAGAKRLWVLMEHTSKDGRPKIVERCGYPLTGLSCVTRVYTNLAVLDLVPGRGFVVREMAPGVGFDTLQERSAARLHLDA